MMKARSRFKWVENKVSPGGLWVLSLGLLVCSPLSFAQAPAPPAVPPNREVARVNGVAITEADLQDEMEALYPSNAAHGGLKSEKLKEIRSKALGELEVEELVYEQAVQQGTLVPMAEVHKEFERLRRQYGAQNFDRSLQLSGLTRQQYLKKLQRRLTLERMNQQHVIDPARVSEQTLRDYYDHNLHKFVRPEQVHARLILVSVDPQAKPEEVSKAKEKIEAVYKQLQAGKDFAALAEQYSDDFYRVRGGDLGWVHRGRLEPDFEKVAFSLGVGQFGEPFRTQYGFNLMKVEGREPARQMKFEDVQPVLKAEFEGKKAQEFRQAWIDQLKKNAFIEIPEAAPALGLQAAH
jgi:parvulin-like peptidyl-prolyl isomerase